MKPNRISRLLAAIDHLALGKGEVAERAGMHRQVLTDILAGKTPGTKHLPALCAVLGVPVEWIETGDCAPVWAKSVAADEPDSGSVFHDTAREIGFRWRQLRSTDRNRYQKLTSSFFQSTQRFLSTTKPLSAVYIPLAEMLRLGEAFGLPTVDQKKEFIRGFEEQRKTDLERRKAHRAMTALGSGAGLSLPRPVFTVCRAALLAMKAQRLALDQPWADIRVALRCLWDRQDFKHTDERLQHEQREADLGSV